MAASTLVPRNTQIAQTIRLLVVEDSEPYLFLIQMAFSSREAIRWELTVAHDGEEAMELLFGEERTRAPLPGLILLGLEPAYHKRQRVASAN
jgi:hypothetical protein